MMSGRYTTTNGRTFIVHNRFVDPSDTNRKFEVCRVCDQAQPDHEYVLKISMKRSPAAQPQPENETRILQQITDPLIVRYVEHGVLHKDGRSYLCTEYVPGENLLCLHEKSKPLALEVVLAIIDDICQALATIHARQILHCDLKPANIFLDYQQHRAVLGDFHIALPMEANGVARRHEGAQGSPDVAAPEQYRGGEQQFTSATDMYCLAVVVHDLLAPIRLFKGRSFQDIEQLRNSAEPRFLQRTEFTFLRKSLACNSDLRGQQTAAVAKLLADCLKSDLSERTITSAAQFYQRLIEALGVDPAEEELSW